MLAPRKKLWSTPDAAIDAAAKLIRPTSDDTCYDVGCGDGRVIIRLASTTPCRRFVGIEIDEDRAQQAEENIEQAKKDGLIPRGTDIVIRRQNALEMDYSDCDCAFLYLVPRGLRLIKSVLLGKGKDNHKISGDDCDRNSKITPREGNDEEDTKRRNPLRVVTYMAGFADESYVKKELCTVDHQEGAAWPIYLYHLER